MALLRSQSNTNAELAEGTMSLAGHPLATAELNKKTTQNESGNFQHNNNATRGTQTGKRRRKWNKKKNKNAKQNTENMERTNGEHAGHNSQAAEPQSHFDHDQSRTFSRLNKPVLDENQSKNTKNDSTITGDLKGEAFTLSSAPSAPLDVFNPPTRSSNVPISPRKRTLMRHKKSDNDMKRESFILDAKGNLRNRNSFMEGADTLPNQPVGPLNINEKVFLFEFNSAKVVLYHEMVDSSQGIPKESGTLLGHGSFEVFQLHKGDVTYLSCGSSFVYPLLPKLKILRTDFNQFILPLANPERYWRISLNTEDVKVIRRLEKTLEEKVQYRNFYLEDSPKEEDSTQIANGSNNHTPLPYPTSTTPPLPVHHYLPIAHELPESPPSAPISPQQANPYKDTIDANPIPLGPPSSEWPLRRKISSQSITSAIASFNHKDDANEHPFRNPYQLEQPRPRRRVDPGKLSAQPKMDPRLQYPLENGFDDRKSESSMDSLLDEFEENISITRSMSFAASRPVSHLPSRAPSRQSLTSAVSKPRLNVPKIDDLEFPSTSFSEYNKMPSRRSSRSELYTSETNWMEPNAPMDTSRLPRSRSSYSVASSHYNRNVKGADLNSTYHNIYRSITQRNLSQYGGSNGQSAAERHTNQDYKTPSIRSYDMRAGSERSFTESVKLGQSKRSAVGLNRNDNARDERLSSKLNSTELYNMIRAKRESNKAGAPKRFFGWG